MSALICDICGGNLAMNESGEFAVCESCGMKHSKERVKVKVQEIQGTVKIDGAVETVKGDAEKERLIKNAETFLQMNDKHNALIIYEELSKTYPESPEIWNNILMIAVNDGICLCKDTHYGKEYTYVTNEIEKVVEEIIRTFNAYAITSDEKENIETYANIYYNNLCNGNIVTSIYSSIGALKNFLSEDQIKFITITGKNNAIAVNKLNILQEIVEGHYDHPLCKFYFGRIIHFSCRHTYGNTYDIKDEWTKAEIVADAKQLSERLANEINIRKLNKRCQHCGGEFKGIFNKVCSKCGKPKDY